MNRDSVAVCLAVREADGLSYLTSSTDGSDTQHSWTSQWIGQICWVC